MTKGERIKYIRENILQLSQVAMAKNIQVSKQTLYKYENGIITNIPSDKIEAIASLANVSPAFIMGWDNKDLQDAPQRTLSPDENNLIDDYEKLNDYGKEEARKSVHNLTRLDEYKKQRNAKGSVSEAG